MSGNCKCDPPYNVLVGPGREVQTTATFTVTDRAIAVKAFGLTDDDCVQLVEIHDVCGEEFQRDVCDPGGGSAELSMGCDMIFIAIPGTYRLQFEEGGPGDALIVYEEMPEGVNLNVGGSSMSGCCLDVKDVQSMIDVAIAGLDDVRLTDAIAGPTGYTLVLSDGNTVPLLITSDMIMNLLTPQVLIDVLSAANPQETLDLRAVLTQLIVSNDPNNSIVVGSDGGAYENDTV